MTFQVHYRVALVAEVELETGEMLSVHIADEQIDGPPRVTDDAGDQVASPVRQRAIDVAESSPWPGWTAGSNNPKAAQIISDSIALA